MAGKIAQLHGMPRGVCRRWCLAAAVAALLPLAACASAPPLKRPMPVMGPTEVTASAMAAWFRDRTELAYRATVPVEVLAAYYVEEGLLEWVRGDLAFVQAVHETRWFAFTGVVDPVFNNFAGIGATDRGGTPHRFEDARTGVRAQIQHLRAYADPDARECAVPPLRQACADPRFHLVRPKGRARTWQEMGKGNWATDPKYALEILTLYHDLRDYAGLPSW